MKNKTQCPNCLTVYVISDEQFLRSKGKVRCGNCRTPFIATSFSNKPQNLDQPPQEPSTKQLPVDSKITAATKNSDLSKATVIPEPQTPPIPQPAPFDDKLLPIEDDEQTSKVSVESVLAEQDEANNEEDSAADIFANDPGIDSFTFEDSLSVNDLADERAVAEMEASIAGDESMPSPSEKTSGYSFKDNIQSELSIEMGDESDELDEEISLASDDNDTVEYTQGDLNLEPSSEEENNLKFNKDQSLITTVDELVDSKLVPNDDELNQDGSLSISHEPTPDPVENAAEESDQDQDFELLLDKPFVIKQPVNKLHRWVYSPLLLIGVLLLVASLCYQLWLRQAHPILEHRKLTEIVSPVVQPLALRLDQHTDLKLPVRRDLANLQLVSARTETHPTRASTTLLKVSMVNQSKIAQPFPWLELSLSDENGRLVARRAMSPDDYLYNNRLDNLIGANELRPITIELLSFPEQARGYELKLLSN